MDKYKIKEPVDYRRYVIKYCKYGMSYFCDGTPNLSVCEDRDNPKPIKPCKYINSLKCPVRQEYKSKSLPTAKKGDKNETTIHTPNSADID